MLYQLLVSNDLGLFEAIHALLGAIVDPPLVVNQYCEVVRINDFLWDNFQGNAHEIRFWLDIIQVNKLMSNRHLAPGVDTTLLKTNFAVVTDAVGPLRFTVKSKTFPPTVNLVCSLSSFSGFTLHIILPYVTF